MCTGDTCSQGISLTALKNACKYLGIDNWPKARQNLAALLSGELTKNSPPTQLTSNSGSAERAAAEQVFPFLDCPAWDFRQRSSDALEQENNTNEINRWPWGIQSLGLEELMDEGMSHTTKSKSPP